MQLDDSQSAPERTQAIHDAFKRAQIDQDPDRIRDLLRIVGVVDPDPESTTSDATYFADLLSGKLKRGGPNEQRRNWFMGAGILVERQPTRASGAPVALAAQAGPVRPTSTMNETQILLAPPPKKGAPTRDKSASTDFSSTSPESSFGDESPEREKPTELEMLADIDRQIARAEERGDADSAKALKDHKVQQEAALASKGKDRAGMLASIRATKKRMRRKDESLARGARNSRTGKPPSGASRTR